MAVAALPMAAERGSPGTLRNFMPVWASFSRSGVSVWAVELVAVASARPASARARKRNEEGRMDMEESGAGTGRADQRMMTNFLKVRSPFWKRRPPDSMSGMSSVTVMTAM